MKEEINKRLNELIDLCRDNEPESAVVLLSLKAVKDANQGLLFANEVGNIVEKVLLPDLEVRKARLN